LDAQFYGVPQRRRRIFFVGHFGEPWSASAEILFELEGSGGDSASGCETGTGVAGAVAAGAGVLSRSGGGVVPTVSSKWHKGTGGPSGDECQNLVLETHTHTHTVSTLQGGGKRGYRIDAESAAGGHLIVGGGRIDC
jgi:DNA (cytosine-5)-methyltransferase 1